MKKHLIYTTQPLVIYVKSLITNQDLFFVSYPGKAIVGEVFDNTIALFEIGQIDSFEIENYHCRVEKPDEDIMLRYLNKGQIKKYIERLEKEHIKQSEEFHQMKEDFSDLDKKVNIELTTRTWETNYNQLKIGINTNLIGLTSEWWIKQLDKKEKAMYLVEAIRGVFDSLNLIKDENYTKEVEERLYEVVQEFFEIIKEIENENQS